jgi:hypothetical protein
MTGSAVQSIPDDRASGFATHEVLVRVDKLIHRIRRMA